MKLEEVTKELIEEYRKTKKLPENNFLYTYKNEKIELFDAILKQFNPYGDFNDLYIKKDYLDNLTDNTYIKSITKDGYKYFVSTQDGTLAFYDAHNLYQEKQYPYEIEPGHCYTNATIDCKRLTESRPGCEAKVNIGWVKLPYEDQAPIIHAVCSFKAYDSMRYVIDYNLNLVMEEQMYKKFLNFQEINVVTYGDIMQILNLHELIKDNKNFKLELKDYKNALEEGNNRANIAKELVKKVFPSDDEMNKQIEELNNVYARMIAALTVNMGGAAPVAPSAPQQD